MNLKTLPMGIIPADAKCFPTIAEAQAEALYKLHPLDKQVQQQELQAVLNAEK